MSGKYGHVNALGGGKTLPADIEAFFTCPKGHNLPHRTPKNGRCSPFDCCEAKGHAWQVVRAAERAMVKETSAYAEETQKLREAKDRQRAWNDAHALPPLPSPPRKTTSVQEYLKKRMDQIAPLMLEMKIRKAMLSGHDDSGLRQADDLLDRQGTTRNPANTNISTGPVLILNFSPEKDSPYEAQKRNEAAPQSLPATIDGELIDPSRTGRPAEFQRQAPSEGDGSVPDANVERSESDDAAGTEDSGGEDGQET